MRDTACWRPTCARHFLQEDKDEEFAANVLRFVADTRKS
jgi:hypothetical protein